jgi:hypothetical protein
MVLILTRKENSMRITSASTKVLSSFGESQELQLQVQLGDSPEIVGLFSWFTDERSVDPSQFIGMTVPEAEAWFSGEEKG